MDPALILLMRLRFWGWLRRNGRKLATARGLLLTSVGLLVFVPSILAQFLDPKPRAGVQMIDGFRRFGPLFFLVYCVTILLFSPGDKAFAFTPSEVGFLFPAPFKRRALLAYKIAGNLALTCLSGLFLVLVFRQYWTIWLAGYVGVVLTFAFLQLFQIGVTVIGQTVGASATTWRRRLAVGLVIAFVGGAALTAGRSILRDFNLETIKALETAPAVRAAMMPFRPFIYTVSASRIWPDMIGWACMATSILAAMTAAILALDAQYLEAAAASSEQLYAKLERMRKGGPAITSFGKNKKWKEMPAMPWWGGVGPIFWRQLTSASRDYARGLVPIAATLMLAGVGIYTSMVANNENGGAAALGFGGIIIGLGLVFTNLLTFDFRGDFDRIEGLKTLPIRPSGVVLGQIAAPCLLLAMAQIVGLIVLGLGAGPVPLGYWALILFVPLLDLLLLEIDNLAFLLYPSRPMAHNPGDVQAMGKVMVLTLFKMFVLGITLGFAALLAALGYFVGGWIAAGVVAWLVMAGMIALFVPLLAMRFVRFDVASETPS